MRKRNLGLISKQKDAVVEWCQGPPYEKGLPQGASEWEQTVEEENREEKGQVA